jgi:hypothetical protein
MGKKDKEEKRSESPPTVGGGLGVGSKIESTGGEVDGKRSRPFASHTSSLLSGCDRCG